MNRLQALRTEKGINMKEAAQALSMPYTTYVNYEKGTREPSSEVLIKLAKFYDTSIDYLVGKVERVAPIPAGFQPLPKRDRVPRVGQIACGEPILAEENIDGYDEIPDDWGADFTLLCRGDSMEPKIKDGDVVAIRTQPQVENGEIAAVRIGEEATLKRVYCNGNTIILQAENPTFPPLVYSRQEAEDIHIEGKAVGLCRKL